MLTNMLPNQGNGTFNLFAYADDVEGHRTLLGTKTITCDNAHATKPFGAIDTPTQGGTVSGSAYVNFGWALTPTPNTVPFDGSTVMVYIDGVPVGHPTYNQFRSDIATLFPGRTNSGGAVGFFTIDTTTLSNGVHTIRGASPTMRVTPEGHRQPLLHRPEQRGGLFAHGGTKLERRVSDGTGPGGAAIVVHR